MKEVTTMKSYIWLLPTVRAVPRGRDLFVHRHGKGFTLSDGLECLELLALMDGTRLESELSSDALTEELLAVLTQLGWVVRLARSMDEHLAAHPHLTRQLSYYAHLQPLHPDRALEELGAKTVLVIGNGGIGIGAAMGLAGAGVGRLILNDIDRVELSNLNRQFLFTPQDVGSLKSNVLAREIQRRFPNVEVEVVVENLTSVLPGAELILHCGENEAVYDSPALVGDRAIIICGYHGREGAVGPLIAPELGTMDWPRLMETNGREQVAEYDKIAASRRYAFNSSGSPNNLALSGLLTEAAIRYLAPSLGPPVLLGEQLRLSMDDLSTRRVELGRVHDLGERPSVAH